MTWLLVVAAAAASLAGCQRAEAPRKGQQMSCTCTYLTDFDDTARIDVDVCVAEGRETLREVKFCALQSAHNHIDGCTCKPPTGPCDPSAPNACINR